MSASAMPVTPQSRTSYVRSSPAKPNMQEASVQQPHLSAPASQESIGSLQSAGSSIAPRLYNNSSNVSQLTSYTDLTSPGSKQDIARARTPEESRGYVHANDITSPMSVTSPAFTNGTKRTASGQVKTFASQPNTPATFYNGRRHSRTDSMSSSGSRAGELAMNLKTRLGYAMAKVQHGWEHKDIHEVEQLAAYKTGPNRHSMSHLDYHRRPLSSDISNGFSNAPGVQDQFYYGRQSTAYPPSKRHSGSYASFMPSSQPIMSSTPRLQPAADIRPSTSYRQYHTAPSSQTGNGAAVMSPPRTPNTSRAPRPPTIRTDTQTAEAERDALGALMQLGSPHTSQGFRRQDASQASSSQASPLRYEFATPRKVTFARSESDSSTGRLSSNEGVVDERDIDATLL